MSHDCKHEHTRKIVLTSVMRYMRSAVWCDDCDAKIAKCTQCRGLDGSHKLDCTARGKS